MTTILHKQRLAPVKTLQNRPAPATLNPRRATPQSTGQADQCAVRSCSEVRRAELQAASRGASRARSVASSMALDLATTKSPRRALGDVSNGGDNPNDNCCVRMEQQATVAQMATTELTTADHALRLGLPRIDATNAAQYPPADLHKCRAASTRAPADSSPALWFWQMTGDEWSRDGHSYDVAKKRYRRMVGQRQRIEPCRHASHACSHVPSSIHASQLDDEYRTAERERELKRDRSARVRPQDDGAQAALRKKAKRKEQTEVEDQACRATASSLHVQRDGYVRLLLWPSSDRYWLEKKRKGAQVSRMQPRMCSVWDSDGKGCSWAAYDMYTRYDGSVEVRAWDWEEGATGRVTGVSRLVAARTS